MSESDLKGIWRRRPTSFKLDGSHKDSVIEMHRGRPTVPPAIERRYNDCSKK